MAPVEPTEDELARLFDTVVGTVTLRASDLGRQRDFYGRGIGLEARNAGSDSVALADAAGRTVIRLDSTRAAGGEPLTRPHTGLFHNAFRYPDRAALGAAVKRTFELAPVFEGASDHGVSDAVYFRDPEGNGVELYRDRPYAEWPAAEPGRVGMYTRPLDLAALVGEAAGADLPARCDVGHIHLQTADVEATASFWRDAFGLDERQRFGPQAVFLAEGLYHHHIGANTWRSAGAPPAPPDRPGLEAFELRLRSAEAVASAGERLERAGVAVTREDGRLAFADPDSNRVLVDAR
jgi:catechol 2,3-dioxygenase